MHGSLAKNIVVGTMRFLLSKYFRGGVPPETSRERELIAEARDRFLDLERRAPVAAADPSEKTWRNAERRIRRAMLDGDMRRFLRFHVIVETVFTLFAPYIEQELRFLKGLADWDSRWKPALRESWVGDPIPYWNYRESSGNLIHIAYGLAEFEQRTGRRVEDLDFIFEFGGGYGCLCRLAHRLNFKGKYLIFDRPTLCALQQFYLQMHGVRLSEGADPSGATTLSDLEKLEPLLDRHRSERSLFVASWSLSETPLDFRRRILRAVSGFRSFLFGYQHRFKEVDNLEFFAQWIKDSHEIEPQTWTVPFFPNNSYLIGVRRPDLSLQKPHKNLTR